MVLSLIFSGALFFLGVETGYYLKVNKEAPGLVVEVQEHPPLAQTQSPPASGAPSSSSQEGCQYVGSRNSDLYHLPTCAAAKRIKPENLVCFATPEEAAQKGYKPGCLQ
jgi:hypothetical protein